LHETDLTHERDDPQGSSLSFFCAQDDLHRGVDVGLGAKIRWYEACFQLFCCFCPSLLRHLYHYATNQRQWPYICRIFIFKRYNFPILFVSLQRNQ
jgi:hypothetical protein